MGLRMKNFDILDVHWEIWLLVGEVTKNRYRDSPKRGASISVGGDAFEGGVDALMHTMV